MMCWKRSSTSHRLTKFDVTSFCFVFGINFINITLTCNKMHVLSQWDLTNVLHLSNGHPKQDTLNPETFESFKFFKMIDQSLASSPGIASVLIYYLGKGREIASGASLGLSCYKSSYCIVQVTSGRVSPTDKCICSDSETSECTTSLFSHLLLPHVGYCK